MRRALISLLAILAMLGTMLLALPAAPVGAAAVTATITPTPGIVEFTATGFRADENLSTWLTGPRQQVQAAAGQKANGRGEAVFQLRIPRHFEPGRWAITVYGLRSDDQAIGFFEVGARGPDLALAVNPASGPAGTTFIFSGSGFEQGEKVGYWLTGPDGVAYEGGVVVAGAGGSVSFSYTIGLGTRGGRWVMSAYGLHSDRLAEGVFTVG
jgi:hypothetical protein